ncbi:base excision DNA repair protein [Geranomyces variabilis]|nr:base excision DNA repair protein [Geranomyces variabilis]KAJ3134650.1 hypothetical protein HDU90_004983 [Geranomyces variabilis]
MLAPSVPLKLEGASLPADFRQRKKVADKPKKEVKAALKRERDSTEEPLVGSDKKRRIKLELVESKHEPDEKGDQSPAARISSTHKKKAAHIANHGTSPFPTLLRPTAAACKLVTDRLAELHGRPRRPAELPSNPPAAGCGAVRTVLDALVRTILSQNTTSANSTRAWNSLAGKFGVGRGGDEEMFMRLRAAPVEEIEDAIRCGGLAKVKSRVIWKAVNKTYEEKGSCSLEHLRACDDVSAMSELMAFDGVGPKTASCVLLFCLSRPSFAVDTHVFRISKSLGWVPPRANREQAQAHLETMVPPDLKYALHCLLVTHGKTCASCGARSVAKQKGACPLKGLRGGADVKEPEHGGDAQDLSQTEEIEEKTQIPKQYHGI